MKNITKGTEKQIAYAETLRDEYITRLANDAASDNEVTRRTAKMKIAKIEACDDAAALIDWIKDGIHLGKRILSIAEEEEIRLGIKADRAAFNEANPEPTEPEGYMPAILRPGHRRRRRNAPALQLTDEQQAFEAKCKAYEKACEQRETMRVQYLREHDPKPTVTEPKDGAKEDKPSPAPVKPVKTVHYLDLHDIAQLADITDESARQYHKRATANRAVGDPRPGDLPAPDVVVGTRKQAMRPGWSRKSVDRWLESRPRKGGDLTDFKPGTACNLGYGEWLVVVRSTRARVWLADKYLADGKVMTSYFWCDIYVDAETRYLELGRHDGGEVGPGIRIEPKRFSDSIPLEVMLDDADIQQPDEAYEYR